MKSVKQLLEELMSEVPVENQDKVQEALDTLEVGEKALDLAIKALG